MGIAAFFPHPVVAMQTEAQDIVYQLPVSLTYHRELLHKALPDPADTALFNRLMAEARSRGLAWIDGLEYVIDKRRAMLN